MLLIVCLPFLHTIYHLFVHGGPLRDASIVSITASPGSSFPPLVHMLNSITPILVLFYLSYFKCNHSVFCYLLFLIYCCYLFIYLWYYYYLFYFEGVTSCHLSFLLSVTIVSIIYWLLSVLVGLMIAQPETQDIHTIVTPSCAVRLCLCTALLA